MQRPQRMHTDERIDGWLDLVRPLLLEKVGVTGKSDPSRPIR